MNTEINHHVNRINNDHYIKVYKGKVRTEDSGDRYGLCQLCRQDDDARRVAVCDHPSDINKNKIIWICEDCHCFIDQYYNYTSNLFLCLGKNNYRVDCFELINK